MDLTLEELQLIPKDVSPHQFEEIGVYKNVTVQVLRCLHCGELSVGWIKQPDTKIIYEKDESNGR